MPIYESKKTSSFGSIDPRCVQRAKIKSRDDKTRNGKCQVWLVDSNTNEQDPANWITVSMSSPYSGTSPRSQMSNQTSTSSGSQSSYGFMAGPPDVDNHVLVTFSNGQMDRGFVTGSIKADNIGEATFGSGKNAKGSGPGGAREPNAFDNNVDPTNRPQRARDTTNNESGAIGAIKASGEDGDNPTADQDNPASTDSSIRRNTSPDVMGLASPGGNYIVFDDGAGIVRIAMASGAQILMSNGMGILVMNSSGAGWVRLSNGGDIDVYGAGSVSLAAGADFNLKAGGNINLEAGGAINTKASGNNNIQGATVNIKGGSIMTSKITGDIAYADTAGAAPLGSPAPVGDVAGNAGSVARTPGGGGGAK